MYIRSACPCYDNIFTTSLILCRDSLKAEYVKQVKVEDSAECLCLYRGTAVLHTTKKCQKKTNITSVKDGQDHSGVW